MRRPDVAWEREEAHSPAHPHTIGTMPVTADPFVALGRDAAKVGLRLTAAQLGQCERYAAELIERNETVNLTAITEPRDVALKHFLDSFTVYAARRWTGSERLVDVGSGAGFPGLALRIALPGLRVTCVESVGKKARFIEEVRALLALSGVDVANARSEELARDGAHRARYDVATARALGSLAQCVEYLLPFLRVGGEAVVWKGRIDAELPAAERALASIGGSVVSIVPTASLGVGDELPGRNLVVVRKTRATPERYPRSAADMKRRPW